MIKSNGHKHLPRKINAEASVQKHCPDTGHTYNISTAHTMKLSVPFIPDPGYIDFLTGIEPHLSSLYFSLNFDHRLDARSGGTGRCDPSMDDQVYSLCDLKQPSVYLLVNTRFSQPQTYLDTSILTKTLDTLERIVKIRPIQGIVFSDFSCSMPWTVPAMPLWKPLKRCPG